MKKLFSLISVFALAMGAMAATQSVTLTITGSNTVTDNKVSQNGVILSNVDNVDVDGMIYPVSGSEFSVSLEGGYSMTKIVITPQEDGIAHNAEWIVEESYYNEWKKEGNDAVWEGDGKSVFFGSSVDGYPVKDIIVYYDDATATAAVEAQADKQKAVKSVNRFGEVTIEADGVKFGINGVKK